jgi:PAS domain S-box-containing protein
MASYLAIIPLIFRPRVFLRRLSDRLLRKDNPELRKLQRLVEQSPSLIIITDKDGNIEFVNRRFSQLTGYALEEVVGRNPRLLKSGLTPDDVYAAMWRQLSSGQEWRGTLSNRTKSGDLIYVDAHMMPILDEERNTTHYAAIQYDITQKLRMEDKARETEQRLKHFIEHSTNLFYVHTHDHRLTYLSPQTRNILHCEPEEALRNWKDFLTDHPANVRGIESTQKAIDTGERQPPYELELRTKSGTTVWVEVHESPVVEGGKTVAIVGSLADISARKVAEEALQLSERKYRELFEESRDVVFMSTPSGRFLDINRAGVDLLGYANKEEVLALDIGGQVYADPEERQRLLRLLDEQDFVRDFKSTLRRRDGTLIRVLETTTAVRDASGAVKFYRGILRDITEQERLEGELRQSQKMEAIGRLAGGIAHDFNNLLTAILGYGRLLEKDILNPSLSEHVQEVIKAAEGAASLTRQLLAFSRKQIMSMEVLDLNEVVRGIHKMLRRLIGEDIRLDKELSTEPTWVEADRGQIEQVILNLVINAQDAVSTGGRILVQTRLESQPPEGVKPSSTNGPWVVLSVQDTGVGMDAETLSHIFEPFFTTKKEGKGTGLGLSTVYGVIKQSEGEIRVTSSPNEGTIFDIFLPSVRPADETRGNKTVDLPDSHQKATVLVVEDDSTVRNLVQTVLLAEGHRVLVARGPEEAMDIVHEHNEVIDLLLTDVVMPTMDGHSMARTIQHVSPAVKVLFMSGYANHGIVHEGQLEHNVEFIQKPFTPDELVMRIQQVLCS